MFCKKCGMQLQAEARFCKKCGAPVATSVPAGVLTEPSYEAPPRDAMPARLKIVNQRALWIGVAVALVLAAAGYYWYSRASFEQKIEAAARRGDLLKPVGASAYDYYQQLKQGGMSESARARLNEKIGTQVATRPQQMIADLTTPGKPDATLNDWQEAQTLMQWASELKPGDNALAARANYCAGRAAFLSNRKDEALQLWKQAAEQDATWAMPLNGVGLIYNERKNYQLARSFFFEAIRREPQFALPYNNIGTSFFYEKNDAQAESYYRQAIERAPQWPRPHVWLGDIAVRRKAYDQAVREYETALDLDPAGTSGIDVNKLRQGLEQARGRSATAAAAGDDSFSYEGVRGSIGTLQVSFSFNYRNGQVTGSYRYEGRGESLRLAGSVSSEGVFTLTEFAPDGRQTGTLVFKGRPTDDAKAIYSGTWTSADGQRKLPFKLEPLGD